VTIEDAAELQLKQPHVVRLETRPANIEGQGAVRQRQLLVNSLRMRPDRIVVGEVRGEEALDMLQAMNTGHDGSLTTVHANTPRDAVSRLEVMVSLTAATGNLLPGKSCGQFQGSRDRPTNNTGTHALERCGAAEKSRRQLRKAAPTDRRLNRTLQADHRRLASTAQRGAARKA